ncbi:unnamed protein product [Symbiodinium natans]|uniref:Uncharacterized protein n=1 Tax=Symbiodinium natans TaxID=878477 RepID=A0A812RB32_9DINO|nr:unnamed protein product [Symbiodinium natans]
MALRLSAETLAALEAEDPAVASPQAATPPTSPPGSFVLKKDLGSLKDVDVDADASTAPSSPLLMEAKTPSAMPWWWRVVPKQEPRQGETERALAALRAEPRTVLETRSVGRPFLSLMSGQWTCVMRSSFEGGGWKWCAAFDEIRA